MSPLWGFRVFGDTMFYKHIAPLGLRWFIGSLKCWVSLSLYPTYSLSRFLVCPHKGYGIRSMPILYPSSRFLVLPFSGLLALRSLRLCGVSLIVISI